MVEQHYRWDFIGLSTDTKPTPETSEKVVNGSTFYCSDNSKLYVFCDGTWYERKALGGGGGGGGSYTAGNGIDITDDTISVDTTTIQEKLTAGSNVTISDNTISATDTTYSAFTGTDGTAAGTAGLVPAPATTDAGKFLGASGLWEAVQAGGVTELTSADYNYPTDNPTTVALWLLNEGVYTPSTNSVSIKENGTTVAGVGKAQVLYIISDEDQNGWKYVTVINPKQNSTGENIVTSYKLLPSTGSVNATITSLYSNNMVQTTGTSTTDVMSQNATTSMVFADPGTTQKVQIGNSATAGGDNSVAVGRSAQVNNANGSVALGYNATVGSAHYWSLALGANSSTTSNGEVSFGGPGVSGLGYNSSNYRLLTNVYDPQTAHDAATKGYVDAITLTNAGAPTTATVGTVGQLLEDTTNGKLYICTDATNPYVWEEVGSGGGSGPTVVQTTGTSTTDVMSQNAVTSMVFADPETKTKVQIGNGTNTNGYNSVAIGRGASATGQSTVAIGGGTNATEAQGNQSVAIGGALVAGNMSVGIGPTDRSYQMTNGYGVSIGAGARVGSAGSYSVAIGAYSQVTSQGEFAIAGSGLGTNGYNGSQYRLLTGLYDGQSDHDAATVGQIKMGVLSATPTGTTAGFPGRLYTYDSGGGTYEVYLCVHDNGDNTYVWKQVSLI